jgi:tetratricopeptide (TPR) repeat protein
VKDYTFLSFPELEALLQRPTDDPRLILAYCEKALFQPGGEERKVLPLVQYHARLLMEAAPQRLAALLQQMSPNSLRQLPSIYFLRLGSQLELLQDYPAALRTYQCIVEAFSDSQDAAAAWLRAGHIQERYVHSPDQAAFCYDQLLRRFPQSGMAVEARRALEALRPGSTFPVRANP